MQIDFIEPILSDIFYHSNTYNDSYVADLLLKQTNAYIKKAEDVCYLLSKNRVSDKDFGKIIENVSYIDLNSNDYLAIFKIALQKVFVGYATLHTSMVRHVFAPEKQKDSFDYFGEDVGIDFRVAYSIDCSIDYDKEYTVQELRQLLKENKIVIIEEMETRQLPVKSEKDGSLPIINLEHIPHRNDKFRDAYLKYLRRQIDHNFLRSSLDSYLHYLKREINQILAYQRLDNKFLYLDRISKKYNSDLTNYEDIIKLEKKIW